MARPENPLDAAAGPEARFAQSLRQARANAGLSQRQLAQRANYSPTAISRAASGNSVPSWHLTRAYLEACGEDPAMWRQRWEMAKELSSRDRAERAVRHAAQELGTAPTPPTVPDFPRVHPAITDKSGTYRLPAEVRGGDAAAADAAFQPYLEMMDEVERIERPDQLISAMKRVRLLSGNPSYNRMSARARQQGGSLARSTVADLLSRSDRLPSLDTLIAFLRACDFPEEGLRVWQAAWRRLKQAEIDGHRRRSPARTGYPSGGRPWWTYLRAGWSHLPVGRALREHPVPIAWTVLFAIHLLVWRFDAALVSVLAWLCAIGTTCYALAADGLPKRGEHRPPPTPAQLREATRALAQAIGDRSDREMSLFMMEPAARLHVSWKRVRRFSEDPADAPDFPLAADAFHRLDRPWLFIVGDSGTGKSSAALLLGRTLLDSSGPRDPIPVRFPLSTWDPALEHLHSWMEKRLTEEHSVLADTRRFGQGVARLLVSSRSVLPIFDGLDEMPEESRHLALDAIAETMAPGEPLILTCRTNAFLAATARTNALPNDVTVIRPLPLGAMDAHAYFKAVIQPRDIERWQPLLDDLVAPAGTTARTLNRPLDLWMARMVCTYANVEPATLTAFPEARELREFLLERVVPSMFSGAWPPGGNARTAPDRALTFLTVLARQLGHHEFTVRGLRSVPLGELSARLVLKTCRVLPWRLRAFLDEAADRGVLCTTPMGYRFRHPLLREHLAARKSHIGI